jgi:hypothetical protein
LTKDWHIVTNMNSRNNNPECRCINCCAISCSETHFCNPCYGESFRCVLGICVWDDQGIRQYTCNPYCCYYNDSMLLHNIHTCCCCGIIRRSTSSTDAYNVCGLCNIPTCERLCSTPPPSPNSLSPCSSIPASSRSSLTLSPPPRMIFAREPESDLEDEEIPGFLLV